jgi:nicotinate-nucleotide pyrophosphorylase (carboxylating)
MERPLQLPEDLSEQVSRALREDLGAGDVTARLVAQSQWVRGEVVSREDAVICGAAWVRETFRQLDERIELAWSVRDGERVRAGGRVFGLEGPARAVLSGERTALNFLQLLSGTASAAHRYVEAVSGTGCTVLDTRKTIPGLRTAQKYAVRCGGARNHRMGLFDQVLIKENHIAAKGSLVAAVAAAKQAAPDITVEVEVESLVEFEQALGAQPDIVMLDDFALADMQHAVAINRARGRPVKLEASGGVDLERVRAIAATGVDYVSVGAITKNVQAIDLSMRLDFV